ESVKEDVDTRAGRLTLCGPFALLAGADLAPHPALLPTHLAPSRTPASAPHACPPAPPGLEKSDRVKGGIISDAGSTGIMEGGRSPSFIPSPPHRWNRSACRPPSVPSENVPNIRRISPKLTFLCKLSQQPICSGLRNRHQPGNNTGRSFQLRRPPRTPGHL